MSLLNTLTSPAGLRRVLAFDAISGAGTGALQLGLTSLLSQHLGLPTGLLQGSGIAIFIFVTLAAWTAAQAATPHAALGALVVGNFAWVAGCLVLLFGSAVSPTPLGQAYLVVQAVVVLVLAELQWMAWRRQRPAAMA